MGLKTEAYYDVQCNFCGFYISSDWNLGMFPTRLSAEQAAKRIGFKTHYSKNICPHCLAKLKNNGGSFNDY